jgi:hypothetical protein
VDGERRATRHEGEYAYLNTDGDRYWRPEAMYCYWCYLEDYVPYMASHGCADRQLVVEAWVTLIFRAFLLQKAHIPIGNVTLPSKYYGSRLPIYIS